MGVLPVNPDGLVKMGTQSGFGGKTTMPVHIGIIPDGNRRYAKKRGIFSCFGHKDGISNMEKVVMQVFEELGTPILTIYTFSLENFNRPRLEVAYLMRLLEAKFRKIAADDGIHRNEVKVRAVGRLNLLPPNVRAAIKLAEDATKRYKKHLLNLAIAYDGRAEIVDAVRKLKGKRRIDESALEGALYFSGIPATDLVIRTGGEQRLSGFLLWNSSYAELIFRKELWPEYTKDMLLEDMAEFGRRQRRFGR